MKIQILSDLHLEFMGPDRAQEFICSLVEDVDVLVIAGDITTTSCSHLLKDFCDLWPKVVYVTGNHFYYGSSFKEAHEKIEKICSERDNFYWLNNSSCEIDGQRFVGGTLWFEENEDSLNKQIQMYMNDFHTIKDLSSTVFKDHDQCVKAIKDMARDDTVVVTHHLPHENSVAPRWKMNILNCFFQTDLSKLINLCQPKLWIHGHTHDSCDYVIGKTRIVCNPYGYARQAINPAFKKDLIIEV